MLAALGLVVGKGAVGAVGYLGAMTAYDKATAADPYEELEEIGIEYRQFLRFILGGFKGLEDAIYIGYLSAAKPIDRRDVELFVERFEEMVFGEPTIWGKPLYLYTDDVVTMKESFDKIYAIGLARKKLKYNNTQTEAYKKVYDRFTTVRAIMREVFDNNGTDMSFVDAELVLTWLVRDVNAAARSYKYTDATTCRNIAESDAWNIAYRARDALVRRRHRDEERFISDD